MSQTARGLLAGIRAAYDKLALFGVLFALLCSVIVLGVLVNLEKKDLAAAGWNRAEVTPRNVEPVDVAELAAAIDSLAEPFQMEAGAGPMLVAEIRVACVKCGRPIPYAANVCPYKNCGVSQPTTDTGKGPDADLDRMPDEWERKYELNPALNDSRKDADGDQWANLEEYEMGTNPQDAEDYPPPVNKLRWTRIVRTTLPFSFQSVQQLDRNDPKQRMFVLKNKKIDRDYYVRLGDKVEDYEVLEYEEKKVPVQKPGVRTPVIEDQSVLKLRKAGKIIALTRGQEAKLGDMVAELIYLIDKSKYIVKLNQVITLKNNKYKIIDIQKDSVVVSDNLSGIKTAVEKYVPETSLHPAGGEPDGP